MHGTLDVHLLTLNNNERKLAVAFLSLARKIARSLSRDDEAEGVALLALCEAIRRHRGSEVDLKVYLSTRVRQAVKRARKRSARLMTNVELGAMTPRVPSEAVELPPALVDVARLRAEGLTRRAVARDLGIPCRLVAEREEATRRFLES